MLRFIATLKGLTAFRTEWMIFGEEERLAGSIDFVATDAAGELTLFDWKRSRGLQNKYPGHGLCHAIRQMLPPLEHLADCSGVHYRLQLNCYKYILQKYYGARVAKMLVVCTHPENLEGPFVDPVPDMQNDVERLMEHQRLRQSMAMAIV